MKTHKTKGYKVTDKNLQCRGYQFELNKKFKQSGVLSPCNNGFHFCERTTDCFEYYSFDTNNRVFEIVAYGEVKTEGDKSCTLEIEFTRELSWYEVLVLCNIGKDNTGRNNSGDSNSGDRNSGNWNSGNSNSGNSNSGYRNSGDSNSGDSNSGDSNSGDSNSGYSNSGDRNSGNWNSGNSNSGDSNSGDSNSGYSNSGDRNSGNWNSGNRNSGDSNSGYRNSGDSNSGYSNSGDRNSGNWNSGDSNSGDRNSGYRNSGDSNSGDRNSGNWNSGNSNSGNSNSGYRNSGDRNSGNWNSGNRNSGDSNSGYRNGGAFCTDSNPKLILFDVQTDILIRDWEQHPAVRLMNNIDPNIWVYSSEMTLEEKTNFPTHETTGGYLKSISMKEAWSNMWGNLSDDNKKIFTSLPHFNKDKFFEITGINV